MAPIALLGAVKDIYGYFMRDVNSKKMLAQKKKDSQQSLDGKPLERTGSLKERRTSFQRIADVTGVPLKDLFDANPELQGANPSLPLPPGSRVIVPLQKSKRLNLPTDSKNKALNPPKDAKPVNNFCESIELESSIKEGSPNEKRSRPSLRDLSKVCECTVEYLKEMNPTLADMDADEKLAVGTQMRIPRTRRAKEVFNVTSRPSLKEISQQKGVPLEKLLLSNEHLEGVDPRSPLPAGTRVRVPFDKSATPNKKEKYTKNRPKPANTSPRANS